MKLNNVERYCQLVGAYKNQVTYETRSLYIVCSCYRYEFGTLEMLEDLIEFTDFEIKPKERVYTEGDKQNVI